MSDWNSVSGNEKIKIAVLGCGGSIGREVVARLLRDGVNGVPPEQIEITGWNRSPKTIDFSHPVDEYGAYPDATDMATLTSNITRDQARIANGIVKAEVQPEHRLPEGAIAAPKLAFATEDDPLAGIAETLKGADYIINAIGMPRKDGQSREELAKDNIDFSLALAPLVKDAFKEGGEKAFLINIGNPVDATTNALADASGMQNRMLGLSGVLDTARMVQSISLNLDIPAEQIEGAAVVGMHGAEMVPTISNVRVQLHKGDDWKTLTELAQEQAQISIHAHNNVFGQKDLEHCERKINALCHELGDVKTPSYDIDLDGLAAEVACKSDQIREVIAHRIDVPVSQVEIKDPHDVATAMFERKVALQDHQNPPVSLFDAIAVRLEGDGPSRPLQALVDEKGAQGVAVRRKAYVKTFSQKDIDEIKEAVIAGGARNIEHMGKSDFLAPAAAALAMLNEVVAVGRNGAEPHTMYCSAFMNDDVGYIGQPVRIQKDGGYVAGTVLRGEGDVQRGDARLSFEEMVQYEKAMVAGRVNMAALKGAAIEM